MLPSPFLHELFTKSHCVFLLSVSSTVTELLSFVSFSPLNFPFLFNINCDFVFFSFVGDFFVLFFTTFMASSTMSSSKSSLSLFLELLLLLLIPTHLSTLSFPFYALLFTVDAWENNAIDENIADGQSPPSSEVAVLDIETIIQRAVQEEEKKEIVKNESHFLDYIKTKKDTPSKNYWTKDKSGFFESVLAR